MSQLTILILADQPWQLELAAKFSHRLRKENPNLDIQLAATDYYTFLHEPLTIKQLKRQYAVEIHDLKQQYLAWQSKEEPNITEVESQLTNWANSRILSRPLDVLARTNQLIFGWERAKFYLPVSSSWQKKILLDSIFWSENLIETIMPDVVISIERNTLCNNLIFEISKNVGIEHVTFILSRFGNRWIPHSEFGLGFEHPLSTNTPFSKRIFPKIFYENKVTSGMTKNSESPLIYRAPAINLQNIMSMSLRKRISYIFGKDLGNGVSNLPRLLMQIYSRIKHPRKSYQFKIVRLEQNLIKLTLWELKQILFYSVRLLGLKKWGIIKPLKSNFLFWGLHSRPEDSTSVLGFGLDEIELVAYAASKLPKDVKLLVKEHPIMFGTRSAGFYKKLRNISGVILVDAFAESKSFINSQFCLGVIGISGTMLLESEIHDKSAYSFGSPEFEPFLSTYQLTFDEYLQKVISINRSEIHGSVKEYADFVEGFSSNVDVAYLHDLADPKVRVMLNHWTATILGKDLSEKKFI